MQQVYDYNFYNDWFIIKKNGGIPCFMEYICDDHFYTISIIHSSIIPNIHMKKRIKYIPKEKYYSINKNIYGSIVARLNKKRYEVTFISKSDKHDKILEKYINGFSEIKDGKEVTFI